MADVFHNLRRRPMPHVEKIMASLESTCRTYDSVITRVIWIVGVVMEWMVVAETLLSVTDVQYAGSWVLGPTLAVDFPLPRAKARVMHRVMRTMRSQCEHDELRDGVVVAPQVRVDGEPYMYRMMVLCADHTELVNPTIAVRGAESGQCQDEHDGATKTSFRNYPITVHSAGAGPHTLMRLADVCTFMHALSLLDSQW